ncbi:MAG: heme exporter protein CcmD [Pseudomonadales bacterium]
MYFSSITDLMYMDGHGPYVWGVYAVAALMLLAMVISPLMSQRQFFAIELQRQRRAQAAVNPSKEV